ncbi:MAG: substrate-binding domain-containing protein [Verrucomicrobiota bacterium]
MNAKRRPIQRIAIVISDVFVRRLAPSLSPLVRQLYDFRIVSIQRSFDEIRDILDGIKPSGVITEWLPDKTEQILDLEYPFVVLATDNVYPDAVSIDVDDIAVGQEAAKYFLRSGGTRFGYLGNELPYSKQRLAGFSRELQVKGFTVSDWVEPDFSGRRYWEDIREPNGDFLNWIQSLPKPISFFAAHDPLGRFLCEACRKTNIRVPEEISVVGANNDPLVGELSYPPLSSVRIPWGQIGRKAGDAMSALLEGKVHEPSVLVAPEGIEVRQSSDTVQAEDPVIRKTLRWMKMNHQEPVGIDDLCRDLRLGRRMVERRFSEHLGRTPFWVLSEFRVETAKTLLRKTGEPMSWVAELSGLSDAERLAVVFRRVTGKRPSDFRKQL